MENIMMLPASYCVMNEEEMTYVLGVDEDTGARICHGKWQFAVENIEGLMPAVYDWSGSAEKFRPDTHPEDIPHCIFRYSKAGKKY